MNITCKKMATENRKSQACALQHALCMGLIDVNEVVVWADTLIRNADEIDDWLTELALCKTNSQALTLLAQVPGGSAPEEWWPLLKQQIAQVCGAEIIQPQTVVTYCHKLALSGAIPAYDCEALYQFELEYDSIFAGYGTQAEVDEKVVKFFK